MHGVTMKFEVDCVTFAIGNFYEHLFRKIQLSLRQDKISGTV